MMPDFLKNFWSCTLADNGLFIWTTKNASCCGQKLWSLVVSICAVTGGRYYSAASVV